jgi:hypothetical protein
MDEETENKNMENQDEIKKLLGDAEAISTIFNEPTNLLKDLMDSFGNKSYANTLNNGSKVLGMLNEPTEQFIKLGMAFSISAAGQWVSTFGEIGVDISKAEDLLSKAREQFFEGDFPKVNKTIGDVRDMIPQLKEEQKQAAEDGISATERLIEEAKNVGANIENAERDLKQAKNFLEVENYLEVGRLTKEAKEAAENARRQRIQSVSDALLFTRSVIDESKEVGVDTSEPEALYREAKAAFGEGDFQKCTELTKEAEEKALNLQDEHIEKVLELKEKRAIIRAERERVASGKETPEEANAEKEPVEENCPSCGSSMRWVKKYNRYWCRDCKKYSPKK